LVTVMLEFPHFSGFQIVKTAHPRITHDHLKLPRSGPGPTIHIYEHDHKYEYSAGGLRASP
jgi:hypothetical protein